MRMVSPYHVLTLVLSLGCGARTGLVDDYNAAEAGPRDGGPPTDPDAEPDDGGAHPTDGGGPPSDCERRSWNSCVPLPEPVLVSGSDLGQAPDVVFTGEKLLVIYDSYAGGTVASITLDGQIDGLEPILGTQRPRIAWNRGLETGLVVMDSTLQWIDEFGRPIGEVQRMEHDGWQLNGDVAPVEGGFILLSGVGAHSEEPPLYWMHLGQEPEPFDWMFLHEGGPRAPAEHCLGADGFLSRVVSATWSSDLGELYRYDGLGELTVERALDGTLPTAGFGFPGGLAELDGRVYLLWGGSPSGPPGIWSLTMVELDGESTTQWRIERSSRGSAGHLIVLGGELVIMSSAIHPSHQMSLTAFDPEHDEPMGDLVVLGGEGRTSHSPRMALTDEGLAAVWSEGTGDVDGNSTLLQVFDCCER